MKLILASQSPYRRQLLEEAGYQIAVVPADVAEPDPTSFSDLVSGLNYIAQLKARTVAERGVRGLILAADTVGRVGREVFGKPESRADAERMLRAISGATHLVSTGWCLLRTSDGLIVSGVETTEIRMRAWTAAELQSYLDGGEWQGKCGAYGLQLPADPFVVSLIGSSSNVVGVPLERLAEVFREFPSLAEGGV